MKQDLKMFLIKNKELNAFSKEELHDIIREAIISPIV